MPLFNLTTLSERDSLLNIVCVTTWLNTNIGICILKTLKPLQTSLYGTCSYGIPALRTALKLVLHKKMPLSIGSMKPYLTIVFINFSIGILACWLLLRWTITLLPNTSNSRYTGTNSKQRDAVPIAPSLSR